MEFDKLFLISIIAGTLTFPAYATTPDQLEKAKTLLDNGNTDEAFTLLEKTYNPEKTTSQEIFLLGISAKKSGYLKKALQYFRSALEREPKSGRIRLELAEVLFSLGKLDEAKTELLTVQQTKPPKQVRQNIDSFIAHIDTIKANPNRQVQGPKKNWNGYITTGFTSDSNVNAGPDTNTVFLYGFPFTLSSTAQETQDGAWFVRVGTNHQFKLESGVVWRSGANLAFNNYFSADVYDTTTLSASTGPYFRIGDTIGVSVPITFNMQKYNEHGGWYSQSSGIAPSLQYAMRENLQLYLSASATHNRFNDNASRDLNSYTLNLSLNFKPNKNGNIVLGFNLGHENSNLDIYTNDVRGVYLGYQHNFREQDLRTKVTASYTDSQFEGIQAAYTVARRDVSRKVSASMTYILPQLQGVSITGTASYQDNNSNLPINTYERALFSLSLTKRF